ncbi:anaerobic selenocysteine-containing dehydrogenase [Elusimicrobium posterum]|uniref:hypothetical protein n=1 Tax=Elusimicrobium posterum TaxID=3116653 RepID=UPI003C764F47
MFGLHALKDILEQETIFVQESEVVAAASAACGMKLQTLKPAYARAHGYPMFVPVKGGTDAASLAAAANAVIKEGVKSERLKKFAHDAEKGKIKPDFL